TCPLQRIPLLGQFRERCAPIVPHAVDAPIRGGPLPDLGELVTRTRATRTPPLWIDEIGSKTRCAEEIQAQDDDVPPPAAAGERPEKAQVPRLEDHQHVSAPIWRRRLHDAQGGDTAPQPTQGGARTERREALLEPGEHSVSPPNVQLRSEGEPDED